MRVTESACVFCGGAIAASPRGVSVLDGGPARLGRAAILAFGIASASAACHSPAMVVLYGGMSMVESPPAGCDFPDGADVGGTCSGDVYVSGTADCGYLFCDTSTWAFTSEDPSVEGYTLDSEESAEGSSDDSDSTSEESSSTEESDESGSTSG